MAKKAQKHKILYCSSEVAPFSKTGGLADVARALPAALAAAGHEVTVVTPLYRCIDRKDLKLVVDGADLPLGGRGQRASVWRGQLPATDVPVYFIDCESYFDRDELYQVDGRDYEDNIDRFAYFSRGALEVARLLELVPDIIHCNDWQTALVPVYLKTRLAQDPLFASARTVLTIHNLAYQGVFPRSDLPRTGLPWELFSTAGLEFYGGINLLKGGILFADSVNTVSPTYAEEIRNPDLGVGLDGVLREQQPEPVGILNGVDYTEWSPAGDEHLPARYDENDLAGKAECKRELQRYCGFAEQAAVPLLGMVSRLDAHKGVDLLIETIPELLQLDVQVVILGRGHPDLEKQLTQLAKKFRARLSVHLALDVPLSHRILAGADISLVPSKSEPCGLTQLYSMHYGTIPVVRRTGGLADTVVDYMPSKVAAGTATGFHFVHYSAASLLKVLMLAMTVYETKPRWQKLMATAMAADFGWARSATRYARLYASLREG